MLNTIVTQDNDFLNSKVNCLISGLELAEKRAEETAEKRAAEETAAVTLNSRQVYFGK